MEMEFHPASIIRCTRFYNNTNILIVVVNNQKGGKNGSKTGL